MVAEQEGVGEGFEREGVLGAGNHYSVSHRPEGQDQLVVGQCATFPWCDQVDYPPLQVDAPNRGLGEPGSTQEGTDGKGTMAHVEGARANLK